MKTLAIKNATASLADYVEDLEKDPVIVTSGGKPVAALVSLKNVDAETLRLSNDPRFLAIIERSRRRHRKEGGIPSAEMRRRLNISPRTRKRS
jgi:prevent-host-death family protein